VAAAIAEKERQRAAVARSIMGFLALGCVRSVEEASPHARYSACSMTCNDKGRAPRQESPGSYFPRVFGSISLGFLSRRRCEIAPVFLKSVRRVVALLTIYYFVLLVQALLEREMRRRSSDRGIESLSPYPEERQRKAPTTRRLIDFFGNVQQHVLKTNAKARPAKFTTEPSELQLQLLELLNVPTDDYDA